MNQGQIWTLPKLSLVYSTEYLSGLLVMQDNLLEFVAPSPDDPGATGEEVLDEVLIVDMGERVVTPYMFVRLHSYKTHA